MNLEKFLINLLIQIRLKNAGIFFYVFSNEIKTIVGDFELK